MLQKVGFYSWAGPGTARILKTKYFDPKINIQSLKSSYDYDYLKKAKKTFGITDAWVSYSWGFSDKHEQEDYHFILTRLKNFKKLNIKTHAYLQGCNLVYSDFKDNDFWCRDEKGRFVTYYKGRKVACVNNPYFVTFFKNRLEQLLKHDFDGVYVDNIQMGQLGVPMSKGELPFVFAGCNCSYCQRLFKAKYKKPIPVDFETNPITTKKYLDFRVDSLTTFVSNISKIVHQSGKQFGTNSYDPKFNTNYVYGFDILKLERFQDYLLFENHALKDSYIDNNYIDQLELKKPVFILSYKKGIGFENEFTQHDFDLVYSEAKRSRFFPVIKASEFTTNAIWHNLTIERFSKPRVDLKYTVPVGQNKNSFSLQIMKHTIARSLVKRFYNQGYTLIMENKTIRPFMKFVYELVLH